MNSTPGGGGSRSGTRCSPRSVFTDLLPGEQVALHRAYLQALVGEVFGRPSTLVLLWLAADAEPDSDMWATVDETQAEIIELHQRSAAHSKVTIESLPLDAPGEVPWWPLERRRVRQQPDSHPHVRRDCPARRPRRHLA